MPTKKPRAQRLETATQRRKLPIAKRPVYAKIAPNIFLGYRRNEGPGTWNVRVTGPGIDWVKRIGLADDFEPSDGRAVLTYWQALDQARKLARRQPGDQARGEWPEHVMREVIGRALRAGYKLPKAPEMQEWCENTLGIEPEIRQMQRFLLDLRTPKKFLSK